MPTQGETTLSTFLFCRSSIDGTIAPVWNDACETQLRGEFEIGLTVGGRYLLQQPLGQGSMGRVFLAKDLRLDRPVAMKVVSHGDYSTEFLESVLEREAKMGAGLQHQATTPTTKRSRKIAR